MSEKIPPIGTLTDRVTLQQKATSSDESGGRTTVFVPRAKVWARVRTLRGRRTTQFDGRAATVSHTVVLRYRNDIGAGDRIVYRGRKLEVLGISDFNGRRAYLNCACAETAVIG